jgi:hypothetical protein
LVKVFKALTAGVGLFSKALWASPITWLLVMLGLIFVALEDLYVFAQGGDSLFGDMLKGLGFTDEEVEDLRKDFIELGRDFKLVWEGFLDLFREVRKSLGPFRPLIAKALFMPLMLLIGVLGALVKGISWLSKVAGRSFWYIKQVWDLTTEAIELAWTKVNRKLQELWDQYVNWYKDTCEKIKNFFISAWDSVNNAIMETGEFIQKYVIDPIMTAINWLLKLKGSAGNYIDQIGQGASDVVDTVKGILGFGGDNEAPKPLPGTANTPQQVNNTNNYDVKVTANINNPKDSGASVTDATYKGVLQAGLTGQASK